MRPKNLIPLAHVEHGWVFGNSLSVFGEAIGGAVQLPLDAIEDLLLAAVRCGDRARPIEGVRVDIGLERSRHPRSAQTGRRRQIAGRRSTGQRPVGRRALRDGAHSGGPQPAQHRALSRRRDALRGQSARRLHLRDRHRARHRDRYDFARRTRRS